MSKAVKFILKTLIFFLTGVLVLFLVFYAESNAGGTEVFSVFRKFSDGCFVAAVLLCAIGLFMWLDSKGAFDFLGYVFYRLGGILTRRKENAAYSAYSAEKHSKKVKFPAEILISGIIFLVLAGIFAFFC